MPPRAASSRAATPGSGAPAGQAARPPPQPAGPPRGGAALRRGQPQPGQRLRPPPRRRRDRARAWPPAPRPRPDLDEVDYRPDAPTEILSPHNVFGSVVESPGVAHQPLAPWMTGEHQAIVIDDEVSVPTDVLAPPPAPPIPPAPDL